MASLDKKIFSISPRISRALRNNQPIVALESTVITHGLPYPDNLETARLLETTIKDEDGQPATIGVIDGVIHIGLEDDQIKRLASEKGVQKISLRDLAGCLVLKESGGTTVAGTMYLAYRAGIKVFATGGIGGVHRMMPLEKGCSMDISTDLIALSRYPLVVTCAGAKAILDIPATVEVLETYGIPVLGYKTDEFPAFYSRSSGIKLNTYVDDIKKLVEFIKMHWNLGFSSGILVVAPPPDEIALSKESIEKAIEDAIVEADKQKIRGKQITPFLLEKISSLTGGESTEINKTLLHNNAQLAAKIACYISEPHFSSIA